MRNMQTRYDNILRAIEHSAFIGGWWYEVETASLIWTDAIRHIHEVDDDYIPTVKDAITFYNSPYEKQIKTAVVLCIKTGKPYNIKARITTAKGNIKWIYSYGAAHHINNKMVAIYGTFQDITDAVEESERLIKTTNATQITLDSLVEGLIVINLEGTITAFNKAAENIFKYNREDIIGQRIETLMPEPFRSRHHGYMQNYQKTKVAKIIGIGREVIGLKSDGSTFPMHVSINPIEGPLGLGYVGTIRDLSEEKRIAEKLDWLSHFDNLTRLPNRVSLINYLNKAEQQRKLALVAINLHDFKKINLCYDMGEGDFVLQAIATRISDFAGSHHFAFKDIADHFWLVIDTDYTQDLASTVDKLKCTLQQVISGKAEHYMSISLGVACVQHNNILTSLIAHAETALFSSKQKGVNQICYFEDLQVEKLVSEYQVEIALRQALKNQMLACWLQPKVDSQYKIVSAEVLVRWQDENGHYIPPDQFIGVAEKTGLIVPLGKFVTNKTAEMLANFNLINPDFTLAMNVSPLQFLQPNFVFELVDCFNKNKANLANLTIEITETLLINDVSTVRSIIDELCEYGISISIDDFGTGHSNLKRIIDMSISELKIDKQFVQNCLTDKKSEHLLSAIVGLSKVMNYQIVAEGVESLDVAQHCIELGIDFLQGYYFGKPQSYGCFINSFNVMAAN
jgi:PAS domain S-box-containing protein/diguanylate cyclase (GGDEF)-like protein